MPRTYVTIIDDTHIRFGNTPDDEGAECWKDSAWVWDSQSSTLRHR